MARAADIREGMQVLGVTDDRWAELREEIEQGWNKARNR